MRHILISALSLLMFAHCSRAPASPTGPTPTPTPPVTTAPTAADIAGTWVGRMTFTWQGRTDFWLDTRLTLARDTQTVTGEWVVTAPEGNDITGTITGTVDSLSADARFTGTSTWSSPATDGTRCRGRATFTGTTVAPLRWQSADGFTLENCTDGPSNITWVMNR